MRFPRILAAITAVVLICAQAPRAADVVDPGPLERIKLDLEVPEFPMAAAGPLFVDVAEEFGMRHSLTSTWGAAWSDADGDGKPDLLLSRHAQAPPTLFLNRGDMFLPRDNLITIKDEDRHPPVWGDMDSDGDQDAFITTGALNNPGVGISGELFRSNSGNYTDIAEEAGVAHPLCRGRGAAWFDWDGDADLDLLYLCSESADGARSALFRNDGNGFTDVAAEAGLATNLRWNGGIFPADFDNDGDLDLFLTAATQPEDRSILYRNDGGRYVDVTDSSGIGPLLGGRGAAWGDYDNDADLDLYVGRGENFRGNGPDGWTWSPDRLKEVGFHFRVKKTADDIDVLQLKTDSAELTFEFPKVPIFIDKPPLDRIFIGEQMVNPLTNPFTLGNGDVASPDGRPDADPATQKGIFIWREGTDRWFVAITSGGKFHDAAGRVSGSVAFRSVSGFFLEPRAVEVGNKMFRNVGGGKFIDVTNQAGVGDKHNTGPVIAGDFDNDGDLDIFGLNGDHVMPRPRPWLAYRNDGTGTFQDVARFLGLPKVALSRKATAVSADYDNDGDLDLWVSNEIGPAPYLYGPYSLLQNQGTGNFGLTVRLVGTRSNRDAIGARVIVRVGAESQIRDSTGGASLGSQNDPGLHFGLGNAEMADSVEVRWPSGIEQLAVNVPAGSVTITEP